MKKKTFPGNELRARREELGATLEDVFRRTRIPVHTVEALERGDLEELPAPCFVVGFIRSYCIFLELSPTTYIEQYNACIAPSARFFGTVKRRDRSRPRQRPAWLTNLITWGVACAVVALCWLAYIVVVRPKSEATEGRVEAGSIEMVLPPNDSDL